MFAPLQISGYCLTKAGQRCSNSLTNPLIPPPHKLHSLLIWFGERSIYPWNIKYPNQFLAMWSFHIPNFYPPPPSNTMGFIQFKYAAPRLPSMLHWSSMYFFTPPPRILFIVMVHVEGGFRYGMPPLSKRVWSLKIKKIFSCCMQIWLCTQFKSFFLVFLAKEKLF